MPWTERKEGGGERRGGGFLTTEHPEEPQILARPTKKTWRRRGQNLAAHHTIMLAFSSSIILTVNTKTGLSLCGYGCRCLARFSAQTGPSKRSLKPRPIFNIFDLTPRTHVFWVRGKRWMELMGFRTWAARSDGGSLKSGMCGPAVKAVLGKGRGLCVRDSRTEMFFVLFLDRKFSIG